MRGGTCWARVGVRKRAHEVLSLVRRCRYGETDVGLLLGSRTPGCTGLPASRSMQCPALARSAPSCTRMRHAPPPKAG